MLVKVSSANGIAIGTMMGAEVNGKMILVANVDGKYYALGGECTHKGCKLSEGTLKEEGVVECPCHGSNFDVKTGSVVKGPATMPEPTFQVKVEKNKILVDFPLEAKTVHSGIDLYIDIHKGQRYRFFKIATQTGILDHTDLKALDWLYDELCSFREHMRLHAHIEETCIHFVLSERVPGGARQLEEEHRIIRQKFDDLIAHFESIRAKPVDFEKRGELVLEFYRAWCRFTAFYFMHIDREEEQIMPALWKLCTPEEIAEIHRLMITNQSQEELVEDFKMMLPNANLQGQVEILGSVSATLSPDVYRGFVKLAERLLEPKDWANLKTQLGLT